jgi:ribosomal protein L34E
MASMNYISEEQKKKDFQMMLACSTHLGTKNLDSTMTRYVWKRGSRTASTSSTSAQNKIRKNKRHGFGRGCLVPEGGLLPLAAAWRCAIEPDAQRHRLPRCSRPLCRVLWSCGPRLNLRPPPLCAGVMVQRVTYRRRKSFQTKSNVVRKVRTPGGKLVVQYVGKRGKAPTCGEYGCDRPLSGVRWRPCAAGCAAAACRVVASAAQRGLGWHR